jgi:hypothetical protein
METQVGAFDNTGLIELETQKEIWQNISLDKLEHKFIVTGIVTVGGSRRRLRICLHFIQQVFDGVEIFDNRIKEDVSPGVGVTNSFMCLFSHASKNCWLMIGHITNSDKCISIVFFENINIYVYDFIQGTH